MNHACNLLFIPQVKTDALGRLSCARKGVHCVCVWVCVHACLCTGLAQSVGWRDCNLYLCTSDFSGWFACFFGRQVWGSTAWPRGIVVPSAVSPPHIPSQSHPQTWCINSTEETTLLSETVWSSRHPGVSGYSADDQMWTFARAPQTSEVRSNLKFYTLPFNHCFIHLLVIPTLRSFCCLLLSHWELRLWTL